VAKNLAPSLVPGQTHPDLSKARSVFLVSAVQSNAHAAPYFPLVLQSQTATPLPVTQAYAALDLSYSFSKNKLVDDRTLS